MGWDGTKPGTKIHNAFVVPLEDTGINAMSKGTVHSCRPLVTQNRPRGIFFIICLGLRQLQWHPTPVLLPGKSHGRRSLVGCSPWGHWGSDMTERLHFHFSLSCIGEGNGNPLQCSCLENPRDGGAWWAAIYGVTQSQTRLKQLSSRGSYKWPTTLKAGQTNFMSHVHACSVASVVSETVQPYGL